MVLRRTRHPGRHSGAAPRATDAPAIQARLSTIKGGALAQASFGQPITRATAQRHLTGVIECAKQFNADESHLVDITELVVFGTFLNPDVQRLGDLDLGVTFGSRIPDTVAPADRREILLGYAKASGRRLSFLDALAWPEREAVMMLRKGSAVINITDEDVRALTDRWEVAYSYDPQADTGDFLR